MHSVVVCSLWSAECTAPQLSPLLICSTQPGIFFLHCPQVAELQRKGDGSAEALYGDCLSTCLQSVQQTSRWTSVHSRSPCLRSWQTLLARLHDIVHKVTE